MKRMAASALVLIAVAGSLQAAAPYSRSDVARLRKARDFSGVVGDGGCLTQEGAAFVRVYSVRNSRPFLDLVGSLSPAARLFALCGLQHLNAPEAADLRTALSSSTAKTRVRLGCVVHPPAEVREFFMGGATKFENASVIPKAGLALVFDHYLLHEGTRVVEGQKYVLRSDVMYGPPGSGDGGG
jgi:hypothetical protein